MKKLFPVLALLFLSACGGGSGPTPPPPGPPPSPPPRPGVLVLEANWTAPLGIALKCGGPGLSSPFSCDLPPGALWGVLPQAGNGGTGCIDPEPNVCFTATGSSLGYNAVNPGMALISATTLNRLAPISVEAEVKVDFITCDNVGYVGPVIYGGGVDDGDPTGNYRASYISCAGGDTSVKLWLYQPTWAGVMPGYNVPLSRGVTYTLGIDWYPGEFIRYKVNGNVVFTEDAGFGKGPLTLNNDPRPALWFGDTVGSIGRFNVFAGP